MGIAKMGTNSLPADLQGKLSTELVRILREPAFGKRVEGFGMQVSTSSPQELAALIDRDIRLWGELVKSAGITAD